MTPERWQQVDKIFQAAIELNPVERAAFLDTSCAGDEQLRDEVESLISSDEQGLSLIDDPAYEVAAGLMAGDGLELEAGQRLGNYEILAPLGMGGMGEVYLAEDTRLGRKIALKLLPVEFIKDKERLRRFRQEARAVSALNHPNILTIHEISQVGGRYFIATEFVDGDTLRQHRRHSKPSLRETLDIAIQVASALSAAHQAGIVHRDIKPENIMLRHDGYIKVLDFGLAKLTAQQLVPTNAEGLVPGRVDTTPGLVMGTVKYMSPEQARGLEVDARSDIFSFGVVLYEMIAGRAPFEGETTSDLIAALLKEEPAPLTKYSPNAPNELQRIVSKTLGKGKEERYQIIQDLLIDLKGLKKKLELESKLHLSGQASGSGEAVTTSGAQASTHTIGGLASSTRDVKAAPAALSFEHIIIGIKRHKISIILIPAALTLLVVSMTFGLYGFIGKLRAPLQGSGTQGDGKEGGPPRFDSLLILPFEVVGKPPGEDYLEQGLADTLTSRLSNIKGLKLHTARVAVRPAEDRDPVSAGRSAGSAAVLDGQIRQAGDRIRVTARLTSVRSGENLWRETFDASASAVSTVLQQIAERVAGSLLVALTEKEKVSLRKRGTESADAYRAYVKGRYYWNKRKVADFRRAVEEFKQAIELDPTYAEAYTGLADSYNLLSIFGGMPAAEAVPKAKAAAEKALEIDDSLAEAHTSLGAIRDWYDLDKEGAEESYRKAIDLKYNYPTAHHWYALHLMTKKRYDEAVGEIKLAEDLDPLSPIIGTDVGVVYSYAGRYAAAAEQFRKVLASNPDFLDAHVGLGRAYQFMGKYNEAIAEHQRAIQLGGNVSLLGDLGWLYAASGNKEEAIKILGKMRRASAEGHVPRESFILVYSALDMRDEAFRALEKEFRDGSGFIANLTSDARLENLRSDPRYMDLARRIGLKF